MGFADSVKEAAWERTRAVSSEITLGRPIGGSRSTMSPALARGLYICTVALLTIATALALAVPAQAIEGIHWQYLSHTESGGGQTVGKSLTIKYVLVDTDGNWVKWDGGKFVKADGSDSVTCTKTTFNYDASDMRKNCSQNLPSPSDAGLPGEATSQISQEVYYENASYNNGAPSSSATGQDTNQTTGDQKGNTGAFNWDSPIESTDVTVDLAHLDHILPSFLKNIYQFILAPLIKLAAGLCQWLLKLVDPSKMVDGNFSGGTYKDLYATAAKINDNVAVPYAKTFIMIVFLVSLLDPGRPRAHDGTPEFIDGFLRRVALLFLAWVFVENALTIVEFIYWLGGNAVTKIVELLGGASGFTEMGTAIQSSVDSTLSSVKFSEYYIVLFLLLVMFAVLMSVFKCVQKIIVVMLLRAGEIYLRASMAAVPFAFFAGERQRMVGMNYMKRFLAVCFQAVVIVVALSFMGVIFTTSSTIISGLIGQASESVPGMTAAATVAQAVLPTVVSVACATAIVDKSDAVANSMFGM